jgi:hypothetical protein
VVGCLCCLRSPDVIEGSIAAAEKLKPLLPQVEGIAPVLEYSSEEMDALPLMMRIRWMIHNHSAHE